MKSLAASLAGLVVLGVTLASATQNPTPFVNQPLIPASVAPGGAEFTLTVNGTGFVSVSTVNWNGSPRTTTFVSSSQVTASIPGSDIATAATASVTVVSPAPGGGTSNVVFLPVRESAAFVSLNASDLGFVLDNPVSLAIGDFNKDGNQDMAVALNPANQVYAVQILLGNGDGTFREGQQYSVSYTGAILAADVNGDGNVDLILSYTLNSQRQQGIGVMLGNGDGTFQPLVFYPGFAGNEAVIADFNGDGALDVAVLYNGNEVCTFLGNGAGSFQQAPCVQLPNVNLYSIAVGDFNSDGKLDVAVAGGFNNPTGFLGILTGNGDGTFVESQTYSAHSALFGVTTADFNGDGKLDLAAVDDSDSLVLVFPGKGDGTFGPASAFPTAFEHTSIASADMNGDGKIDLVTTGYGYLLATAAVLLGNGNGTFQSYQGYGSPNPVTFALADFNNDGKLDVAIPSYANAVIELTQDNGSAVKLSAHSLSFPLQLENTVSNPKLMILTDSGSVPVTFSSINVGPNFSQSNNCKTIQPGASCKIAVFFTPTITGTLTSYLSIAANGGGSPQIVNLSGIATVVSISPNHLNFGDWRVGSFSPPQYVVVTNEGNGSMNIAGIGIVGANAKDFFEANACPNKLQAGASCTIAVYFHPTAPGIRSATLGIEDSGGGSPQKVPLTGTGT